MTDAEYAAIRARIAGLLPIGYVVTALDPTYTHEQVDNVAQVLYTDVPALLADRDALLADNTALRHALVELASTVNALALAQRLQPDGDLTLLQGRLTAALRAAEDAVGLPLPHPEGH